MENYKFDKMGGKICVDIKVKREKKSISRVDPDFGCKGKEKVSMIPYVEVIVENFPGKVVILTPANPAMDNSFQVRNVKEAKLLPEEQATPFHHTIMQLLFVSTRAHRDIQTSIAFLSTK